MGFVDLAIILGSGWSAAAEQIEGVRCIERLPYSSIPALGAAAVRGHAGERRILEAGGRHIAVFCGRHHFYESRDWAPVIAPIDMAKEMGAKKILLTNAAGGINPAFKPGTLVRICDHINLTGLSPLHFSGTFPDQTNLYNNDLSNALARIIADSGVYAYTTGPAFETPAEIRAYRVLGADIVGMSTVPEAMYANSQGIEVAAVSCVTNFAAGVIPQSKQDHSDVLNTASAAIPAMRAIISAIIKTVI